MEGTCSDGGFLRHTRNNKCYFKHVKYLVSFFHNSRPLTRERERNQYTKSRAETYLGPLNSLSWKSFSGQEIDSHYCLHFLKREKFTQAPRCLHQYCIFFFLLSKPNYFLTSRLKKYFFYSFNFSLLSFMFQNLK